MQKGRSIDFIIIAFLLAVILQGCGKPKISDILKSPIDCKAKIEMPADWRGEEVEVKVQIYDCKELPNAKVSLHNSSI